MGRYAIKIQYDGTRYVGYQVQPNGPSIQAELDRALGLIAKLAADQNLATVAAGRTDAGVHALGQVVHFDFPFQIQPPHLLKAMNSILPKDIQVCDCRQVGDDFHARYDAVGKFYRYRVDTQPYPDPFKRLYTTHHPYAYSLAAIQEGLSVLQGENDFTSFCSTKTDKTNKVRRIDQILAYEDQDNKELIFDFKGNGFLYNMIRIIVGTALQIGDGLKPVEEMQRLLQVKDREEAGPTAPAQGLYMMEVYYPNQPFS
ncbi:tRNA pseudouridine(38-40) synthase TruA [Facklamia languida]|uniref:tRNA pseudouridine synthase A n=1 Tax=Facklamia languida CCUG 37842 TaxID=883113 RepID=H3NJ41_9LACT|nr:tRNA pseudouridine(38-40) synthase TruA [Facklamia languida]EHR37122.1 tRNA pseudouridine synthase A [Facklamia languida CCUG 37842]